MQVSLVKKAKFPEERWPNLSLSPHASLVAMQKHGYIGEFELVDDHRGGKIVIELNGRLNKCGVISPRYDIGHSEIEAWIARLLPSRQFGMIVMTTSQARLGMTISMQEGGMMSKSIPVVGLFIIYQEAHAGSCHGLPGRAMQLSGNVNATP